MGIVYTFAIGAIERSKHSKQQQQLSLKNLKSYLAARDFKEEARLVCYDACSRCTLLLDHTKRVKTKPFLSAGVEIYRYDDQTGLMQYDSAPYFDADDVEHPSCFSYTMQRNGIGEQLVVSYRGRVYDFGAYFEDVDVYDSLEELQQHKEALRQKALL